MSVSVARIVRKIATELVNSPPRERLINLRLVLKRRLEKEGFPSLRSDEVAEDWADQLVKQIDVMLRDWDLLGVPRPIIPSNAPNTMLTYRHNRYTTTLGGIGLPLEYGEVSDLISKMTPRDFLLVPVYLLYGVDCDPIIVTDGPGDGGVDCIGQITVGPMRSLCVFVQARTSGQNITKADVQLEYSKFCELQRAGQFAKYLAALRKGASADGISICYVIVANTEFERPAREYALSNGILLRSHRQISLWLSQYLDNDMLLQLLNDFGATLTRDLDRNFASILREHFKNKEQP